VRTFDRRLADDLAVPVDVDVDVDVAALDRLAMDGGEQC